MNRRTFSRIGERSHDDAIGADLSADETIWSNVNEPPSGRETALAVEGDSYEKTILSWDIFRPKLKVRRCLPAVSDRRILLQADKLPAPSRREPHPRVDEYERIPTKYVTFGVLPVHTSPQVATAKTCSLHKTVCQRMLALRI